MALWLIVQWWQCFESRAVDEDVEICGVICGRMACRKVGEDGLWMANVSLASSLII